MSHVKYPAIFHKEDNSFWVEFPDLEGCFSSGESIEEAYENSKDALDLYLDQDGDIYNRVINNPSSFFEIQSRFKDELIMLVEYDSIEYGKKYKTKAVKKNIIHSRMAK